jgi:hypothetical protein
MSLVTPGSGHLAAGCAEMPDKGHFHTPCDQNSGQLANAAF